MFTTPGRDAILDLMDSKYIGLLTAITSWRTPTATEASYTGYSATRPAVTWGAQADNSPAGSRIIKNSGTVTFGEKTDVGTVDILAWGLYTAASAGSLYKIVPLSNATPKYAVAETVSEDFYCPAHGLTTDDRVYLLASAGAPLPTGVSEDTRYFVLAAGLGTNSFRIATTSGGSAINVTAWGACLVIKSTPITVAQNATPSFAVDALSIAI